ncbi:hypothetical protein ACRAWD_28045 [Caulobacter segnis]
MTPWQEIYRAHTGQLETGGVLEFAVKYQDLGGAKLPPAQSLTSTRNPGAIRGFFFSPSANERRSAIGCRSA